ncbi:cell wall integrity and stress response component 1-like [Strongylocentrotus purpuratus]|nr:cell wall integrity and stress response component 1-like [Strongylocentrotus purpuratus]
MTTTEPTTASNMTTSEPTTASDMTTSEPTTASDMTTTASDMTTTVSNMTTTSGTTSTTPSVKSRGTTSAPKARWEVKDKDGKLCMLMDFNGTITDLANDVTEQIPPYASTSKSNCSSSSYSAFVLKFGKWGIVLNFTTRGGSFKLQTISARTSISTTSRFSSVTTDFFDVPLGDYYTCSHFSYSLGSFHLNLTNPSLQPFVQRTEGGDNLGQPYVCRNSHTGIIVGVVIAVIVIIAVIVVTFCVVKRRRNTSSPPYARV